MVLLYRRKRNLSVPICNQLRATSELAVIHLEQKGSDIGVTSQNVT